MTELLTLMESILETIARSHSQALHRIGYIRKKDR